MSATTAGDDRRQCTPCRGTGKVTSTQANKRHGMIKRTNKQIRQQRGTTIMSESDAQIVRKWMPYG